MLNVALLNAALCGRAMLNVEHMQKYVDTNAQAFSASLVTHHQRLYCRPRPP